jgi:hypothetical protein
VFAAAHPGRVVHETFLVADEPGHYVLDEISLGTGFVYGKGPRPSA